MLYLGVVVDLDFVDGGKLMGISKEFVLCFDWFCLNGFKSFVDLIDLVIYEGLIGVVGLNGCGKLNLFEVLCWVMGENCFIVMCGEGMEDVIFVGMMCCLVCVYVEVMLIIDNYDCFVFVGMNDSDVLDIIWCIICDVGFVYCINGKDVWVCDVQILFVDVLIGVYLFVLVWQGQISELINVKFKVCCCIFEEVVGISGLYQCWYEVELKLNVVEVNLMWVDDMLDQLFMQVVFLVCQVWVVVCYCEIGVVLCWVEGLLLYCCWVEVDYVKIVVFVVLQDVICVVVEVEVQVCYVIVMCEDVDVILLFLCEEEQIVVVILFCVIVECEVLDEVEVCVV